MAANSDPADHHGPDVDLGALFDVAPAVLLGWDHQGSCISVQVGAVVTAGVDHEDSAELRAALAGDGWTELIHREDREQARALVGAARERFEPVEGELRLARGDRWAVLRVHQGSRAGGSVSGVLVAASRSYGSATRLTNLVVCLNSLHREDDVVRSILSESVSLLGAHSGTIHVLDDEGEELVLLGSVGIPPEDLLAEFGRLSFEDELPAVEAVRSGKPVMVRSEEERRERYPALGSGQMSWDSALAAVPLCRSTGEPFGVLWLGFPSAEVLDQVGDDFLLRVAAQCGLALARSHQTTVAERNQEQLAFLDALSGALSRNLDVETVLMHLVELVVPRLADWCAVRMVESTVVPFRATSVVHRDPAKVGLVEQLAERLPGDPTARGELGDAVRDARPFVSTTDEPNLLAAAFGDPSLASTLRSIGSCDVVVFPLHARGRLVGTLGFGNATGRPMKTDEFDLAHAVAVRAGVLLDNVRLSVENMALAGQPKVASALKPGHVFISYVREDAEAVDRMQDALEQEGLQVWRDTKDLWPGQDWQAMIRQAITEDSLVFIACFSDRSLQRKKSYQHEEVLLAVEQFRQRRPGDPWLIPVRFTDCAVPEFDLGVGRTLHSLQRVDLFDGRWDEGMARIAMVVKLNLSAS